MFKVDLMCELVTTLFIALCIAIIFLYRILNKRLQSKRELLIQEHKLGGVGEMTAFIIHQWRQPLNSISTSLLRLRVDIDNIPNNEQIIKQLDSCEYSLEHLSSTMDNFKNFYTPSEENEYFLLSDAINDALEIARYTLEVQHVKIITNPYGSSFVYGRKSDLIHVILVIINNSLDAFLQNKVQNPYIKITSSKEENKTKVEILDNGGGISKEAQHGLFKKFNSTKIARTNTGIGLYIAKLIINEKFKGSISAENYDNGTKLLIII